MEMKLHALYTEALERNPDKVFFAVDKDTLSFAGLEAMARRFARGLRRAGVMPGDRVLVHMGNCLELAAAYFACFRLGAVAVAISYYDHAAEAARAAKHSGSRVMLFCRELAHKAPDILAAAPGLACYQVEASGGELGRAWADLLEAGDRDPEPETPDMDDAAPAVILYTSGSTGLPKGVTHTHGSLKNNALNRAATFRHGPGHVFLSTSMLCHAAALTNLLLPMALCGGTAVLARHFTAQGLLDLLRAWRPTFAASGPAHLRAALEDPDFRPGDFAGLVAFYTGGDKTTPGLYDLFRDKTGLELREGLGMTECGGYLVVPPYGEPRRGSVGLPIQGAEVRLLGPDGLDAGPDGPGQIAVRTKAMMAGYWNDPENTAKVLVDGWLLTGDLARRGAGGYYFVEGRIKDTIIHDTGNISPLEVEAVLDEHPGVAASGVVGVPDEEHGQVLMAFILPRDPARPPAVKSLEKFVLDHLAARKLPERWAFVDDLPLTSIGKVDRRALLRAAQQGRSDG